MPPCQAALPLRVIFIGFLVCEGNYGVGHCRRLGRGCAVSLLEPKAACAHGVEQATTPAQGFRPRDALGGLVSPVRCADTPTSFERLITPSYPAGATESNGWY